MVIIVEMIPPISQALTRIPIAQQANIAPNRILVDLSSTFDLLKVISETKPATPE